MAKVITIETRVQIAGILDPHEFPEVGIGKNLSGFNVKQRSKQKAFAQWGFFRHA
jgi:hypothetical protein